MDKIPDWINNYLGMSHTFQYKILTTIILGVVLLIIRRIILHFIFQKIHDVKIRYNWKKGIDYFHYLLFLIIISPIWFSELHSLGTFLGLLTAGLAVALKEPISNLFAWVYIIIKKPFEMGDRIQLNGSEGDVLDIGFFEFTVLEIKNWVKADQSTGRIIHVPNGLIFTNPVMNYNQAMNYIWNEIPITITFESNWQKAKQILLKVEENHLQKYVKSVDKEFKSANQNYQIVYNDLNANVYTMIKENGISLTLRYLCNPKSRRKTEQIAIEEILTQFEKHIDIHFAYPTTRFYQEGNSNYLIKKADSK